MGEKGGGSGAALGDTAVRLDHVGSTAVKREAARLHPADRASYMAGKEGVIKEIEARALYRS